MFTTDVSEDGQSGVHETIYIPVLTSLPSGYVENSSGELTDPNLSTSGDWSSAPIPHKAKSSANYAAIEPHNSNVCKSSSVNINADDEENTHTQIWQGSEGIRDKDKRGASPGYVVFPTKTNYEAFPTADFTTQTSHGLRKNCARDEQEKSSGYKAFPVANFIMQTSNSLGENSVRDEQGKSSGYIAYPAANFDMQTSSGLGENSVRDEQEKSRGYVYFPPIDFREIPIKNSPFPGYVALPPVGCGPHNPQSSIGPGQINRLEAESKTRSKQEANKRDISIKTGAYVAMDSLKLQNLKGETDPNLS